MTSGGSSGGIAGLEDLLLRGRGNEALRLLDTGQGGADPAELLGLRAWALADRAEFEKAARIAGEALALDPNQARAFLALGLSAQASGNAQEAANAYSRAIQADPRFAPAHYQLGMLFLKSGDPDTAQRALTTATALDPRQWCYRCMVWRCLSPPPRRADAQCVPHIEQASPRETAVLAYV